MAEARILIVEDSATQAQALAALLESQKYRVDIAADGDIALERIANEEFDLVLSDVMMQRVGGYELCRRIKNELGRRDLPVVLLTSLTDPLDIIRGLECGADNYITKPYDHQGLIARIRNVLDRDALRRTPRSSMGVEITFLGSTFNITSEKEQILDLFLSSVEDVVNTNNALHESQRELSLAHRELAAAHERLAEYAKQLERRERLTQEKYGSMMRWAAHGIFVLDLDGSILEANPSAAELFGELPSTVTGRAFDALLPPHEAARFRAAFSDIREKGHIEITELSIPRLVGDTVYCELRASTSHGTDDHLVLAILRDVTEQKLALEAVRDGKEMLQTLIEASPLAIIAVDDKGRVNLWNGSAERTFGWTAAEVIGQPLPIVPEESRSEYLEFRKKLLNGERLVGVETVRRTKAGKRVSVSMWAAQIRDSKGGHGVVAMLADTSDRKALEQQLFQAQKMEAVGTLAGGIAHDFNNMLTAITGYSDVLLEDARQPDDARADIQEIRHAAARAATLTRQLLAFSRKQVLQPEIVDVNAVVTDLEKMLRRLIREDIELALELDPQIGPVLVDAGQLQQVVLNLVVNARDALPNGGRVLIETRNVTLDAVAVSRFPYQVQPGRYVAMSVTDNGTGMDASVQQHIFEPFYSTKSKDKGTGLGLSTAYGIVKQSGGYIDVASEPGRGTTMSVYLPLPQPGAVSNQQTRSPRIEQHAPTAGSETVLVAEDELPLRRLMGRILRRAGYTVLEAGHPHDAVNIARDHETAIDVLITDMVMPDMGGLELAHHVMELRPGIRTLFISGYAEEAVLMRRSLGAGSGFVEKPFTSHQLLQRLRELLDAPAPYDSKQVERA